MAIKILSGAGLFMTLILTSQFILAEALAIPNIEKIQERACIEEAKEMRKESITDIRDVYRSEKERLSNPRYPAALREARINRKTDIRAAKDIFKITRRTCKK